MKNFRDIYKEAARNKTLTREDHYSLCILKAMTAKSNKPKEQIASALIQKAFSPTINQIKLDNGWSKWHAVSLAAYSILHYGRNNAILEEVLETPEERKEFLALSLELRLAALDDKLPDVKYSYMFVRRDLSLPQQIVQIGHVCHDLGAKYGINPELHMILIPAEDEKELLLIRNRHTIKGVEFVSFIEPDMNNETTAIASEPIGHKHRRAFKRYELLA